MTDKDLHKLSREDLLKLMLAQSKEVTRLKTLGSEMAKTQEENAASIERLKAKLDEKDETIERLKGRLNEKDALLEKLKKRLDDKDKLLQEQQEQLDGKEQKEPRFDDHVIALQKENAALRQQTGELNGKIGELKALLAQKEMELQNCQEKLEAAAAVQTGDSLDDLDLLMDDFNEKNMRLVEQLNAKEAQLDSLCRQAAEQEKLGESIMAQFAELKASLAQAAPAQVDTQAVAGELREQFAELKASLAEAAPAQADTQAFTAELKEQMECLRASIPSGGTAADPAAEDRLREKERQIQALSTKLEQRDDEIRQLWSRIWTLVSPKG